MLMDKFLDCLIDGDYSALPHPDRWLTILEEYYDLKGVEINEETSLARDVRRLQNHLTLLQICVTFLTDRWSDDVAWSVRKLGYPFKPLSHLPGEYNNDIQNVINKSRTKFVQLQQLQVQYDKLIADRKENKPPTREYYDTLLTHIEEMQGVSYNFDSLTVAKFVTLEKKYWRTVDHLQEKNKNGR